MPTALDKDLVANVKRAKKVKADRPMFFVMVMKGGTAGKLIISKKKIPEKTIAATKKETGGSAVIKGVVFAEDGGLVFETAKVPAATCAPLAKKLLKENAGQAAKVQFRIGRDDEAIEEPVDDPNAPDPADEPDDPAAVTDEPDEPPAPPVTTAEVMARFNKLAPGIKGTILGGGPTAARVQALAGAVQGLAKTDPAQAGKVLDELEPLLAPAPPQPTADPAAEWKARLAEYQPAIKQAIAEKRPNAADVTKLLAQANALSKPGGDMAQALAKLAECHKLATAAAPGGDAGRPAAGAAAEHPVVARFNGLTAAVKQALAGGGPTSVAVQAAVVQAAGLVKAKDYTAAAAAVGELERLLGGPPPAPAGDRTPTAAGLKAWQQARERVVAQIRQTSDLIAATGDPEAGGAVVELQSIVKNLTPKPATTQQVAELDRYLRTDDVIASAEEIPDEFGRLSIREPLLAALEQLTA
jgi:hypothetical protein